VGWRSRLEFYQHAFLRITPTTKPIEEQDAALAAGFKPQNHKVFGGLQIVDTTSRPEPPQPVLTFELMREHLLGDSGDFMGDRRDGCHRASLCLYGNPNSEEAKPDCPRIAAQSVTCSSASS
jgi:hypothetical protein